MGKSKGNPVLDPWYPWDFEKNGMDAARDGARFKMFLAFKTYLWYLVLFLLVPTLLFHEALLKGWSPAGWWVMPVPPWPLGAAVAWILATSLIFKILPDELLKGFLSATSTLRVRLGATGLALLLCLSLGSLLWHGCQTLSGTCLSAYWTTSLLLCPAFGLCFWAVFYAGDFVRILIQKQRVYQLASWTVPEAPRTKKKGELEMAHWSDLHLTGRDGDLSVSGDKGDNEAFRRLLAAYGRELESMDMLLVSGDVADAGRASEWHVFFRDVPKPLFGKMVLVPGNHDMNIVDPSDWFMVEGQGRLLRKKRLIRTMAALNRVQGRRAWILPEDESGKFNAVGLGNYLGRLEKVFGEFLDLLTLLQERKPHFWDYFRSPWGLLPDGTKRRLKVLAREVDRAWEQIFPMAVEIPDVPVVFVILNSNKEDTGIVDNALGELSQGSLKRLDEMHRRLASRPLIHSLHHHVALPRFKKGFFGDVQADMMALLNAGDFIQRLLNLGKSLVFHGHRHMEYNGTVNGKIGVLSAPSTTLGNELRPAETRHPGFYSYRVRHQGAVRLTGRSYWGVRPPWSPPGKIGLEPGD